MLLNTRHRGKQPQKVRQAVSDLPDAVQSAIGAESLAADGLLGLSETSRKFNVHFTHCRTNGTNDVQPHQLTRRQFWQHLVRCFRLAHPRTDTATGSILQFGMVCKELHNDSPREEDRSEHHHGCTHSTLQKTSGGARSARFQLSASISSSMRLNMTHTQPCSPICVAPHQRSPFMSWMLLC